MEHFSALPQTYINSTRPSHQLHAVFNSFLSRDIKQDSATTTTHIKHLISLIKDKKSLKTSLRTIWGKTYDFAEQYRCSSLLYLISVMSQCY